MPSAERTLWMAAISGLTTVTAALVLMVTEQGLSATQPWATVCSPSGLQLARHNRLSKYSSVYTIILFGIRYIQGVS
jgi:hypothetical protein